MASSHGNTHSEGAKTEQRITEFFAKKCLHIILESRALNVSSRNYSGDQAISSPSSSSSSSSSVWSRDKWFNLALRECPAALENVDLWRQSNLEPIVIDVILVQRPGDWDPVGFSPRRILPRSSSVKESYPFCCNSDLDDLGVDSKSGKIVERWALQYENRKTGPRDSNSGSRRSSNITAQTLYKKSTLLLRSLYTTVRLLPAYKIFRDLNSSGQIRSFSLTHRVSSFVEPFTRKEEAEMQKFGFTPVDTSSGRLCLSVVYCPSVSEVRSEPSTPISPQFIPDYVGSPLADPLRSYPLLPVTGLPSHGSPSSLPFSRRHSWSCDPYRASPPVTFSPSPTHSESHASVPSASSCRVAPAVKPPHPPDISAVQKKIASFDEYYPSPILSSSPSPSPSPPINNPGKLLSRALLRSESAPVCIPAAGVANSPAFSSRHNLPPSPPLRGTRCTSKTDRTMNETQTAAAADKLFSLGKDEPRKYFGVKTSSDSSPRISISRSSSRSNQDDFDDPDFTCPFDEDDDDVTDPSGRKSQDAAVGALVRMLKKAPPLHQDFTSENLSYGVRPETWSKEPNQSQMTPTSVSGMSSSGHVTRKTTTDALEEFQNYREMKNLLLMRDSKSHV